MRRCRAADLRTLRQSLRQRLNAHHQFGRGNRLALTTCLSRALPLTAIIDALTRTGYSLPLVRDRSDLLKQLAGQIIFSCGSLEQFWSLFMDPDNARRTACTLAGARLGYYALVAVKGAHHG